MQAQRKMQATRDEMLVQNAVRMQEGQRTAQSTAPTAQFRTPCSHLAASLDNEKGGGENVALLCKGGVNQASHPGWGWRMLTCSNEAVQAGRLSSQQMGVARRRFLSC